MIRALAPVLAAALALPAPAETVIVGVSAYPPYVVREDGRWTGLDVEVVRPACAMAGWECRLVEHEFPDLIPSLAEGRLDAAAAGFGWSAEREAVVDLACSHNPSDLNYGSIYAPPGTAIPAGAMIAAVAGTLHAAHAADEGYEVLEVGAVPEALAAVSEGRVAGYFTGADAVRYGDHVGGLVPVLDLAMPAAGTVIAFDPARDDLREAFDVALTQMAASGLLTALQARWVPPGREPPLGPCGGAPTG